MGAPDARGRLTSTARGMSRRHRQGRERSPAVAGISHLRWHDPTRCRRLELRSRRTLEVSRADRLARDTRARARAVAPGKAPGLMRKTSR